MALEEKNMKKSKLSFIMAFGSMVGVAFFIGHAFLIAIRSQSSGSISTIGIGVATLFASIASFIILALVGIITSFSCRKNHPSAASGFGWGTSAIVIIFFIYFSMFTN